MSDALDLAGAWALEVVVATLSHAPLFGETRSASRSRLLVEVRAEADGWVQRQTVCHTQLEGGTPLARAVLPEAWVRAMAPRSYPVDLTRTDDGWRYAADLGVEVVGYDPARGGMPRRANEPQVVDADGDGKPGATVRVEVPGFGAAEVYVATRGHLRFDGRVVSPDRIEGQALLVEHAQTTLGASHRLFDFTPHSHPDPARSTFQLWRVEPGTDCSRL